MIKSLEFVAGKKVNEKCYKKTKIDVKKINYYSKYALSKEVEINNNDVCVDKVDIARIKHRISFNLKEFSNFRIDVTLSNSIDIKKNPQDLKKYKNLIFTDKNITPENFIIFSNFKDTEYEIEFEYIGKLNISNYISIDLLLNENQELKNEINQIHKFISENFSSFNKVSDVSDVSQIERFNRVDVNKISDASKFNRVSDASQIDVSSDARKYQNIIYLVARLMMKNANLFKEKYGFKKLGNNVKELTKNDYSNVILNNVTNYYVTDKADGLRIFLIYTINGIYKLSDNFVPLFNSPPFNNSIINIFDAEEITHNNLNLNVNNNKDNKSYGIFDYIYSNRVDKMVNLDFEKRYNHLINLINTNKNYFRQNNIFIKKMYKLTGDPINDKKNVIDIQNYSKENNYHIDGLIFNPATKSNYNYMECYKWKPIDHITIDFYITPNPDKFESQLRFESYILCSGIDSTMLKDLNIKRIPLKLNDESILESNYTIIQFSPSLNYNAFSYNIDLDKNQNSNSNLKDLNLSYKIGEFRLIGKNHIDDNCNIVPDKELGAERWELIKIRNDRDVELARGTYFGNDFRIAEITYQNYKNPLLFDDLFNYHQDNYFKKINENEDIYKNLRKYNLDVKHKILDIFIDKYLNFENKNVLDLAGGRGQDLFYFASKMFKKALFVDIDKNALTELITRKFNYKKSNQPLNNMQIYTLQADLNEKYKNNYCNIVNILGKNEKYDLISNQFAIHYFLKSVDSFTNYINLVKNLINENGLFIFTCFDGKLIFDKLLENDRWDIYDIGSNKPMSKDIGSLEPNSTKVLKYSIIKKYKGNKLLDTNQTISAKLPFSKDEYYDEYLVNNDFVEKILNENGFTKLETNSFSNINIPSKLSEIDKQFSDLYQYSIYQYNESNDQNVLDKFI